MPTPPDMCVCVSTLPSAQYGYDLVGDQSISGHGVQLASLLPSSICDLTIEAFVNVSQLGESLLFDISNPGQTYGNVYAGFNGGGRAYIQIGSRLFTSDFVPGTNSLTHYAWQLQRQVGTVYIWVNLLHNSVVTNLGTVTSSEVAGLSGWGSVLTVGQHAGGDYPFRGSFSNFRLSTQAVYASPYTMKPPSYSQQFPLSVASSTAVLLQGKPIANVADPLRSVVSITQLSNFPCPLMPAFISNMPTYGGVGFLISSSTLITSTVINCNKMSAVDWTFDVYVYVANFTNYPVVLDLRPYGQNGSNGLYFFFTNGGKLSVGISGAPDASTFNSVVPLNQWTHCAIMRKGSTLYYFQNGAQTATTTVPSAMDNLSQCTGLAIGAPTDHPEVFQAGNSKFLGSISQPLIRVGAQYATTGFTPTPNLALLATAAGMNTILFVDAVGSNKSPTELVNGVSLTSVGTTLNTDRYMAY